MKIAVVGVQTRGGGGNYHHSLKTYKILSDIKKFKFNFLAINSKKNHNEIDENFINYNTNFIDQLFFLFYSSKIFKSLLKKFKIQNKFEKFIKIKKIDFIIFLGCSRLSLFCDKINYATYIYEFHHIFRPDLPEYKGWSDFDFREDLLKTNVKRSLSLIVDTQKKAEDLYDIIVKKSASLGGVYSAEHGTGKRKINDFIKCYSNNAVMQIKKVKSILDPKFLLNRGNIISYKS